jgi:hypothetical protein
MSGINGLGQKQQQLGELGEAQPSQQVHRSQAAEGPQESHSRLLGTQGNEAIDWTNDPGRFNVQLEKRIDRLALNGKVAQRPWADTYWPTYADGINARWQSTGDHKNDLSPAEKYDAAFNGWDPETVRGLKPFSASWGGFDQPFDASYYEKLGPLAKYCSAYKGNAQTRAASAAGKLNSDGTAKSGRKEEDYGGIETWWGLCHAWCPASIREKEPLKAVEHNGVRFEVSDIKALLIACYNGSNSIMIGGRNGDKPDKVELDANGRPKNQNFRDINPGTFHILLGTMIGRDKKAFIEDRTGHYEVWNQPIAEYRVSQMQEITEQQAAALVKGNGGEYPHNSQASKFFHVRTEVDYITESHASTTPNAHGEGQERTDPYEYILECNAQGEIIGGEWLGSSIKSHPDFLWHAYADGGQPLAPNVDLQKVRILLEKSRAGGGGGPVDGVKAEKTATLRSAETVELEPITVRRDGVLEFTMTGNGDVDAYARIGQKPTFDARDGQPKETNMFMYEPGSQEKKTMNVKAGDVVYVTMRGYDPSSTATLKINQLQ